MPGRLVICATPIGNLDDAPPRLAAALAKVAVIYAEDTRRSRTLLDRIGVDVPMRSFFVGNERSRAKELAERLLRGDDVALVTDAGTPSIADPGMSAVRAAVGVGAKVTVVPGASAVTAALAISGLPADRFVFEGFLPRKAGPRATLLSLLADEERTIVLFAAPSRVHTELAEMAAALGEDREIAVCRELTKAHEEVFRGPLSAAVAHFSEGAVRGELTVVVSGATRAEPPLDALLAEVTAFTDAGASLSTAVRDVAATSGASRRALYEYALRSRDAV